LATVVAEYSRSKGATLIRLVLEWVYNSLCTVSVVWIVWVTWQINRDEREAARREKWCRTDPGRRMQMLRARQRIEDFARELADAESSRSILDRVWGRTVVLRDTVCARFTQVIDEELRTYPPTRSESWELSDAFVHMFDRRTSGDDTTVRSRRPSEPKRVVVRSDAPEVAAGNGGSAAPGQPSANRPMSEEEWSKAEAEALIRYAAPLIRKEHLGLLLAELCESVLPIWLKHDRDDWRLPWCVATLRAWALGEASIEDVRRSVLDEDADEDEQLVLCDDDGNPYLEYSTSEFVDDELAAVASAVAHAVHSLDAHDVVADAVAVVDAVTYARAAAEESLATREYQLWIEALDAETAAEDAMDDRPPDVDFTDEQYAAKEERWEAEQAAQAKAAGAWRRGLEEGLTRAAGTIRSSVPYRVDRATDWRVENGFVRTGGVVLRLEAWKLVDAVAQDQLLALNGDRAVAWDEAQVRAGFILY
jgi:hypothetical protein